MTEGTTSKTLWTAANKVTVARIIGVIVFVIVLLAPWPDAFPGNEAVKLAQPWIATVVFVILSVTDSLDGYLARSRGEVTDFGKFMDPLADKIMVAAAFVSLVQMQLVPAWIAIIILAREFIITGLRTIAANKGVVIAASWYGKAKTVFQIIAIVAFLLIDALEPMMGSGSLGAFTVFAWVLLIIALVLTIISMVDYLVKSAAVLGIGRRAGGEIDGEDGDGVAPMTIESLAEELVKKGTERSMTVATAESLTGGTVSRAITCVSGSSAVLKGTFVTYTEEAKATMLGIPRQAIDEFGVVSREVALAMCTNAREILDVDAAVSMTGIAGPTGAEPGKPVGTVWMGIATRDGAEAFEHHFDGDRESVRIQTAEEALRMLIEAIGE